MHTLSLHDALPISNLNPENTVTKNPIKGMYSPFLINSEKSEKLVVFNKATYRIVPGTNPKETISAKESNCFPSSDCTLRSLATKPSKKSAIAAIKTKTIPRMFSSYKNDNTAIQPQNKFKAVSEFGMMDFKFVNL